MPTDDTKNADAPGAVDRAPKVRKVMRSVISAPVRWFSMTKSACVAYPRRTIILAVGVVVAVVLLICLVVVGRPDVHPGRDAADIPGVSRPLPSDEPSVVAEPANLDPEQAARDAEALVTDFLGLADDALQTNTVPPELEAVAGGTALGEVEGMVEDYDSLDYRQVGDTKIIQVTALETTVDGETPSVLVQACIDTADVDVLDADGASLGALLYHPGHPVPHTYVVEVVDGSWRTVAHQVPDGDATC